MTGFGVVASPALAGVATVFGLFSVGFATVSKRLERKVTKHEKIYTLALPNKTLSQNLFQRPSQTKGSAILSSRSSFVKCRNTTSSNLKSEIKKTKTENKEAQTPDLDKLKGELRKEIKQEF